MSKFNFHEDLTAKQKEELAGNEAYFGILLPKAKEAFERGDATELKNICDEMKRIAFKLYMAS